MNASGSVFAVVTQQQPQQALELDAGDAIVVPFAERVAFVLMSVSVSAFGTFFYGALTMALVAKAKRVRWKDVSQFDSILLALSAVELFVCCAIVPLLLAFYSGWLRSLGVCRAALYASHASFIIATCIRFSLAFERYLSICRGVTSRLTTLLTYATVVTGLGAAVPSAFIPSNMSVSGDAVPCYYDYSKRVTYYYNMFITVSFSLFLPTYSATNFLVAKRMMSAERAIAPRRDRTAVAVAGGAARAAAATRAITFAVVGAAAATSPPAAPRRTEAELRRAAKRKRAVRRLFAMMSAHTGIAALWIPYLTLTQRPSPYLTLEHSHIFGSLLYAIIMFAFSKDVRRLASGLRPLYACCCGCCGIRCSIRCRTPNAARLLGDAKLAVVTKASAVLTAFPKARQIMVAHESSGGAAVRGVGAAAAGKFAVKLSAAIGS